MPKELYERLVKDVLDVIISDGIEVAKKNYDKICYDYPTARKTSLFMAEI